MKSHQRGGEEEDEEEWGGGDSVGIPCFPCFRSLLLLIEKHNLPGTWLRKTRMKTLATRSGGNKPRREESCLSVAAWFQCDGVGFPSPTRVRCRLKRIVIPPLHNDVTVSPSAEGREGGERRRLAYAMCSTLPPRVHPGLRCVASLSDRPRVHLPHPTAL